MDVHYNYMNIHNNVTCMRFTIINRLVIFIIFVLLLRNVALSSLLCIIDQESSC